MTEQEYSELEMARQYIFDSGESNLVKVYIAGLRAGREQAAKKCDLRAANYSLTTATDNREYDKMVEAKACAAAIRGVGG